MIKINLLPSRVVKKKKHVAGRTFIWVALVLLAAEGAGLYFWYDDAQGQVAKANQAVAQLATKVQKLQKVKQAIVDDESKKKLIEEQNGILERLKDGKYGPPNMMLFLSYVLTKPLDTLANRDELTALEKVGWNLQWDPDSVWLKRLKEDEYGSVTIEGEARSHEDVAEFYQRLESSIYFYDIEPGAQERKYDQGIEMKYIAFKGMAEVNYRTPESLPADAPADGKEGDAKKDDAKAAPAEGAPAKDDVIVPGTPSVEAVPGAGDATKK